MKEASASCPACGGMRSVLPLPGPRSMLSDGRMLDRPLAKDDCSRCGLLGHRHTPDAAEIAGYFREGYTLYAHAPGRPEERARQEAYAEWIAAQIRPRGAVRLLEIGCGNGSLLLALKQRLATLE